MAVNLISCLLTSAAFFLTEGRFLVSHTVRTVILIGLLSGFYDILILRLQTFTLLLDGEFGLAFECGYVEYSWSVNCVATGYVWAEFCVENYGDSRGRIFRCDCCRREGRYCASRRDGFCKHSVLHTAKILRLSETLRWWFDRVDSREKMKGSVAVGWNDHGRIGDVGTDKSSSVQGLTARSREGQELSLSEVYVEPVLRYLN